MKANLNRWAVVTVQLYIIRHLELKGILAIHALGFNFFF